MKIKDWQIIEDKQQERDEDIHSQTWCPNTDVLSAAERLLRWGLKKRMIKDDSLLEFTIIWF